MIFVGHHRNLIKKANPHKNLNNHNCTDWILTIKARRFQCSRVLEACESKFALEM